MNKFKCHLCNREFNSKYSLSGHQRAHSTKIQKPITKYFCEATSTFEVKKKCKNLNDYYANPNYCLKCNKILSYDGYSIKFCSRSCNASFNNKLRSKESRTKQKESLFRTLANKKKTSSSISYQELVLLVDDFEQMLPR